MVRLVRALIAACLLALVGATSAFAARPVIWRIDVADIGSVDYLLTDACGVDVRFDVRGHFTFRTFFDDKGIPTRDIDTFALRVRYYAEAGQVSLVEVGPHRVTFHPDGSSTSYATGNIQSIQLPGQGRVYSDVGWSQIYISLDENGDQTVEVVAMVGRHWGDRVAALCSALAPD